MQPESSLCGKVANAQELLRRAFAEFNRPAVMCSFGKDSLVALHLALQVRPGLPVIFHREPFFPDKYEYANEVIVAWNLTVYDFPPAKTALQQNAVGDLEIVNSYDCGGGKFCDLPTGVIGYGEGEHYLCALRDLVLKPRGRFDYPWDLVVHGHKSADVDPFHGPVPLAADIGLNLGGAATPVFPLRDWSDEDIWAYIEAEGLPIHHERYEKIDGQWRERPDKTLNPDYFPACTACLRKGGGPVHCPRLDAEIPNVAAQLPWTEPRPTHYMKQPTAD